MIIKLIAESDAEKQRIGCDKIIHKGVAEYFVMGKKNEGDGNVLDFHEWNGGYKYLLPNLSYFHELINLDKVSPSAAHPSPQQQPQMRIVRQPIEAEEGNIEPPGEQTGEPPIVKRGNVDRPVITPIDIQGLRGTPRIIKMNPEQAEQIRQQRANFPGEELNGQPPIIENIVVEEGEEERDAFEDEIPTPPPPLAMPTPRTIIEGVAVERRQGLKIIPPE